jgi:hypothetical protein
MDNPENPQESSVPVAEGEKPAAPAKPRPAPPARPALRRLQGRRAQLKGRPPRELAEAPNSVTRRRIVWACIWGYRRQLPHMFPLLLPRTIFEPSNTFKIGFPQDFAFGVDTKFQQQFRIWCPQCRAPLLSTPGALISAAPRLKASEAKFKCPATAVAMTAKESISKVRLRDRWTEPTSR